ncbi:hypothetical protein [Tatumella sp. OPLPL6]|uniref:hypothetical protein n=1 Tax=Tatumella sp. OPLPL6 TaxID=1928657 RepID=UPI000C19AA43|nr:hypothetical protein [Tatumella sp. OPLPL6]PIJ43345.1 hypothetical protein BOM24_09275 [Tatumella sp. OPLPL6]
MRLSDNCSTTIYNIKKHPFGCAFLCLGFILTLVGFGFYLLIELEEIDALAGTYLISPTHSTFVEFLINYRDLIFLLLTLTVYILDTTGFFERISFGPTITRVWVIFSIAIPAIWIVQDAAHFTNTYAYASVLLDILLIPFYIYYIHRKYRKSILDYDGVKNN